MNNSHDNFTCNIKYDKFSYNIRLHKISVKLFLAIIIHGCLRTLLLKEYDANILITMIVCPTVSKS